MQPTLHRGAAPEAGAEQFAELTKALSGEDWVLLGAIALECGLPLSVLTKLSGDAERVKRFAAAALANGLTTDAEPRGLLSWRRERGLALLPHFRELTLRALQARGELDAIARSCYKALGSRSVAAVQLALQQAERAAFNQLAAVTRQQFPHDARDPKDWLREHLCCPFDPEWLEATWQSGAVPLAAEVLSNSLSRPDPCGELASWLAARADTIEPARFRQELAASLLEHAALSGDNQAFAELLSRLGPALPGFMRGGYRAASHVLTGDIAGANHELSALFKSAKLANQVPDLGVLAPALALARCDQGTEADFQQAKRLMIRAKRGAGPAANKAFRALLNYLAEPKAKHARVDLYQLVRGASGWELLLLGFAVALHTENPVTRAAWAEQLTLKALEWELAGYAWFSQQAWFLANKFDAEYCQKRLEEPGAVSPTPNPLHSPSSLGVGSLWECISTKPEWQKTLERLDRLSEELGRRNETQYRVAWYVDLQHGSFLLPSLQQYRPEMGVWTQGQRLNLSKLYEKRELLPPEDVSVLDCSEELQLGRRAPSPSAWEALIGHPRVFNGLRGMLPVQVLRGTPRIETEEGAGHIRVVAEPPGAKQGITVVPEAEDRLRVYRVGEDLARVFAALPHGVRVPKTEEAELLTVLRRLSQSVEVQSPELGLLRSMPGDPTPCVRIAPQSGAWLVQLGVRPFGPRGRFFIAGEGRRRLKLYVDSCRVQYERDLAEERVQVEALVAECPKLASADPEDRAPFEAEDSSTFGELELLELLSELSRASTRHELEWPERTALRLRGNITTRQLSARLRSVKGWYLASGSVKLDTLDELTLSELVQAAPLGAGRFLRLPTGDYVEVEARVRRVLAALRAARPTPKKSAAASGNDSGGVPLQVHRGALSALRELAAVDSGFELDRESREWLDQVAKLSTRQFTVPPQLLATLRDYQIEGYVWLCRLAELGLGACLADDMGLGKTLQLIAFLLTRAGRGPSLVVAPTSVCANWLLEIQRFAPSLIAAEYIGKHRTAELTALLAAGGAPVLVVSYALLQQDAEKLAAVDWDVVILDEAQFIKNATSQRARAAYSLTAVMRVAATGTPVENHLGDLWSIFRFLNPGLLGDWPNFRREFLRPSEQDADDTARQELKRRVEAYVLRRAKQDVLTELPPLTEVFYEVRMNEDEANRYALLRKQVRERLFTRAGRDDNKVEVLAELTRLRRFCCHPRLVYPEADLEFSKVTDFLSLVEELRENQHRALVFSQFVDFLTMVREHLDERGIEYEYLDGGTPKAQRQRQVDAFQHGTKPLFLISLKAGGFGLNLTGADYVIHLDPWWNPAVTAQATDRAHRIGQTRAVMVYRMLVKDSIEQSIVELHARKRELAAAFLEGSERVGALDTEELLALV